MKKAFIFDMDGTLIDSMPMLERLDRIIFSELSIPFTKEAADVVRYIPFSETAKYIVGSFNVGRTVEEVEKMLIDTVKSGYETVPVKDGVVPFLKEAKKRGIKMCIATATKTSISSPVAERLGLFEYMDFLVSCVEVGSAKDKPDVFLEAARRLGVEPSEAVVFEDGLPGARSAASAGFTVVGVSDSTVPKSDAEQIRSVSDIYVSRLDEDARGLFE